MRKFTFPQMVILKKVTELPHMVRKIRIIVRLNHAVIRANNVMR